MILIHVDELKEGMMVAEDIQDLHQRTLLAAGCQIQEKHRSIFKKWGILYVAIRKSDETPSQLKETKQTRYQLPEETPLPEIAKAELHCLQLFRYNNSKEPLIQQLFRGAVRHHMLNLKDRE
ncbi:MAG: hypothetical protein G3M78_04205 [Candidatus Nitrohelix vancouverensis]|uniref:Uncharacterized protein n=1 Tax=Candidatus Nitrohelix vancouverensis TaxID=2705534 RepID=A0A7T0C150_9BACT|nr:MAG: hypothetical protein G3M78_04205 [Candidatus Nitrohelix vancouverensis]